MRPTARAFGPGPGRLLRGWTRPPRAALGYALVALLVFLAALAASLPHDLIAARVLDAATAGAPFQAAFQGVSFAFPNGYHFTGLRLTPRRAPEATVSVSELTARTPLLGLLLGRPSATTFSGRAYGGTLTGEVALRGPRTAVHVDLQGAELERVLANVVPPPGRVLGRANLRVDLSGDGRTTQSSTGEVQLTAAGLQLQGIAVRGVAIPDLSFRDLSLGAQLVGSRLQVKELLASGDEMSLGASGDVLLRDPPAQSVLNLRLTVDVGSTAAPALRVAAALLPPRAPGEKSAYSLSGTVAAPILR